MSTKTIQVCDVMTRSVITVSPTTPVIDISRLLISHRIGGVPVVDESGRVVGMVSKKDLFLKNESVLWTPYAITTLFQKPILPCLSTEIYVERGSECVAADIMTRDVVWARQFEDITDVIRRMARFAINRLPVLTSTPDDGGRLCGIVTRSDIIAYLISQPKNLPDLNIRSKQLSTA